MDHMCDVCAVFDLQYSECIETHNNWVTMIKKYGAIRSHQNHLQSKKKKNKDERREQKHSRCRKSNGIRNSIQSEPFQEEQKKKKIVKHQLQCHRHNSSISSDALSSQARWMKMKNDEQAIYEMKMKIDCGVNASFLEKWPISRFLLFCLLTNRHTPACELQNRVYTTKNSNAGHFLRERKKRIGR